MELTEEELIYDWNRHDGPQWPATPPLLIDHSLPAASLTPSATLPTPESQAALVHKMAELGLNHFCLGNWAEPGVQELHRLLAESPLQFLVECAPGIRPFDHPALSVYISHKQNDWKGLLKEGGKCATLVIQEVTRCHPETMVEYIRLLLECGCESICLSGDSGRATPTAVARLVTFVRDVASRMGVNLRVEWSGRNDRSLALYNALAAWRAGATALHCAFFGLGEGAGLVSTELLLVNLVLLGALRRDLRGLGEVSRVLAEALKVEVYPNLPVVGADAFRTATGVHAAAIIKARKKGHDWLADLIYSGVPANQFGFAQVIEVGPMAGASNVQFWLSSRGLEATPERVQKILAHAKTCEKVLTEEQIVALLESE